MSRIKEAMSGVKIENQMALNFYHQRLAEALARKDQNMIEYWTKKLERKPYPIYTRHLYQEPNLDEIEEL